MGGVDEGGKKKMRKAGSGGREGPCQNEVVLNHVVDG